MNIIQKIINKVMGTVTINSKVYNVDDTSTVIIKGGQVIINGVDCTPDMKNITVSVEGNIKSLDIGACNTLTVKGDIDKLDSTSGDVKVTGNAGPIKTSSGDVEVTGNVTGKVETMSGDVTADMIQGGVKTMSGDIKAKNVSGNLNF